MTKRDDTVRFSAEQLETMRRRGESRTDWARVDAMTEAELEASIAADPDDMHEMPDWTQAVVGLPPRKEHINIRIDADVLSWFKQTGRGWQTRMNNVLRAFVESRRPREEHRFQQVISEMDCLVSKRVQTRAEGVRPCTWSGLRKSASAKFLDPVGDAS